MDFKCRICSNDVNNATYVGREMKMGLRDKFSYYKCANCGCLQIAEYPVDIAKYYDGYHSLRQIKEKEFFLTTFLRKKLLKYRIRGKNTIGYVFTKFFPNAFDWIVPNMFNFSSSILDIGSGNGRLVLKMAKAGFTNVSGIDPFLKENINYHVNDKSVEISKIDMYHLHEKYDIIMLHHVLEHLPEQHKVFEKLTSLMHKNSRLIISIPIIDSFAWDKYEMNAFQLGDVPRHYYLHSVNSLSFLMEKYNLKIDSTQYFAGELIFADSEKLKRDIAIYERVNFSKKELNFFRQESKRLKKSEQTGLCCFYLSLK